MSETILSPSVLLAVTGMSPAVLTETVWALAHEDPPEIPSRIIALTTTQGRRQLVDGLLSPSGEFGGVSPWQALRESLAVEGLPVGNSLRFGATGEDIRVFTILNPISGESTELDDIRTASENEAVADFTLEVVRAITENPEIRLIASIAGGRKTMSTILYGCMTLLGREDDRINHVLLNAPYDQPSLDPPFYFPTQENGPLRAADGTPHAPGDARMDLAEIPFIPIRNLFAAEFQSLPGGFTSLVRRFSSGMRRKALESLAVIVSFSKREARVSGKAVGLNTRSTLALILLARRVKTGLPPCDYQTATTELPGLIADLRESASGEGDWRLALKDNELDAGDLSKGVSELRAAFRSLGGEHGQISQALPKGKFHLDLERDQIVFRE